MHFTEDDFENAILELFREQLGYDYVYGPNVMRHLASRLHHVALFKGGSAPCASRRIRLLV
jgi:hypothetical protein